MESDDLITLAIAYYKDKAQNEILERFREASYRLMEADADSRRAKAHEDIMSMAKLKEELKKFKPVYGRITSICGPMEAVDSYIREVEYRIKQLSYKKNNMNY